MTKPTMAYDTVDPPAPFLRNDPAGAAAIREAAAAGQRLAQDGPQAGSSTTPGFPKAEHKAEDDKPSTQNHDLDDLKPGIDAAMVSPSPNKMRWMLRTLSPEVFCEWLNMELNDTDPPAAEDSYDYIPGVGHLANPVGAKDITGPRLTPPRSAMDAQPKGFAARFPDAGRIAAAPMATDSAPRTSATGFAARFPAADKIGVR